MTKKFRARVQKALADSNLQGALDRNAVRRRERWEAAFGALPDAAGARREARRVRESTLERLDEHLAMFRRRLEEHGVCVHLAGDAAEACSLVVDIARSHRAQRVAKSKSMVSEEIDLNRALQHAGLDVVETDLGEFIVQLRGEAPSHITAPAIHLTREEVGATFAERLRVPYTADVETLTAVARRTLRAAFLEAELGISGVNFGVAETGSLCLVTNEGNGRMVTTLPPVHIALMGVERVVPSLEDLAHLLTVLARAATGQTQTSYVTLLQSARRPGDREGPEERHVILVDNGRFAMRASPLAEGLLCIRCGACLNACPVYREIGGHAYASVYPGPIGSVVAPAMFGLRAFGHLARASTLCGACREACPIDIDLPRLLLEVRAESTRTSPRARPGWRAVMRAYAWVTATPVRYRRALRAAGWLLSVWPRHDGWIRRLPPPFATWTHARDFPPPAGRPFRDRWAELAAREEPAAPARRTGPVTLPAPEQASPEPGGQVERFTEMAKAAGAHVVRTRRGGIASLDVEAPPFGAHARILVSDQGDPLVGGFLESLAGRGVKVIGSEAPRRELEAAEAGWTGVEAALADTGSIVLVSGEGRSLLASLLPAIHVAVVPASRVYASLTAWLTAGGDGRIATSSQAVLVTGPSRTADIEMTLTVGVHGPGQLLIVLVEDA